MICENCGKELIYVGKLTEDEIQNHHYIITKHRTADTGLDKNIIDFKNMTSEQTYMYFKAIYELKAEANFLEIENLRHIGARLNVENFNSLIIIEDEVYQHPKE